MIVMMRERKGCTAEIIQRLIQNTQNIKKKDHIKVINYNGYLQFLGLRKNIDNFKPYSEAVKKIAAKLNWAKKLALGSFESELEFKKLIKTSKLHSALISKYK